MTHRQPIGNDTVLHPARKGKIKVESNIYHPCLVAGFRNFMRQFNEEEKAILKKDAKTRFAFVPQRLEISWNPELNRFPFNVLYMGTRIDNGRQVTGSALYEPEFHTYKKDGYLSCMRYRNVYGDNCHLMIGYDDKDKKYSATKYINDECVSTTDGGDDWDLFFIHLTGFGLVNGERCKFDPQKAIPAA
jgi:hypothetical protein